MITDKPVGFGLLFVLLAIGSLSACRPGHAPVYAPTSPAGIRAAGGQYTPAEIRAAVFAGLQAKSWRVLSEQNGNVEAETTSGGHTARVQVKYDEKGWHIGYVSSSPSLKYRHDSSHGPIIHRRYNHWVRLLDEAIRRNLPGTSTPTSGAEKPPAPSNP